MRIRKLALMFTIMMKVLNKDKCSMGELVSGAVFMAIKVI
jgi:hypothetical protein